MDAKQIRDFENECEIMRCPFPSLLTLTHRTARTHRTHTHELRLTFGVIAATARRGRPTFCTFTGAAWSHRCASWSSTACGDRSTRSCPRRPSTSPGSDHFGYALFPSLLQLHLRCSVLHRSRHRVRVPVGEGAGHGHQLPAQVRSYTLFLTTIHRVCALSRVPDPNPH